MLSAGLTTLGLIANLVGVILLFRYGMPYRVRSPGGMFLITEQENPDDVKEDAKYARIGKGRAFAGDHRNDATGAWSLGRNAPRTKRTVIGPAQASAFPNDVFCPTV